jgi:hypothetical protein
LGVHSEQAVDGSHDVVFDDFPARFEEGTSETIWSMSFVGRHGLCIFPLFQGELHFKVQKIMRGVA